MSTGETARIDEDQCTQAQHAWLWNRPVGESRATLILAHGAGAAMDSAFMTHMAELLAARGVAVVRFEFAYMAARRENGKKRPPNPQAKLLEQWRATYAAVRQQVAGPLAIGGKSMGGRMASMLADELGADALICLGYPFHAIGKADKPRVAHLADLRTPTLIVQGERDPMGDRHTVAGYALSAAITLHWLVSGDHDLKPLKASGYHHEQHLESAAQAVAGFLST
ncbi:alpha/beta family hydrolase [Pseudomonas sp. UBA2684]|uniref:alpha/beta family hydrolase n=1 Tax=Pseudomonas sp. UBA2684 TaxID=1947311 RepID=UPI0025E091CC|nr:alpha/beta family hydrolase [Pseudomonas sp. UBA2684]|tara:strand:- start:783 stop:1457 length:675 start_codon:yes stop_codon:yes gene_type:complete